MANILPQLGVTGNPPDQFPFFAGVGFPVGEDPGGQGMALSYRRPDLDCNPSLKTSGITFLKLF
jgi:hypothetical protein